MSAGADADVASSPLLFLVDDVDVFSCLRGLINARANNAKSTRTDRYGTTVGLAAVTNELLELAQRDPDVDDLAELEGTIENLVETLRGIALILEHKARLAERSPEFFRWPVRHHGQFNQARCAVEPEEAAELASNYSHELWAVAQSVRSALVAGEKFKRGRFGADPTCESTPSLPAQPSVALYRWFDESDQLLYVGISNSLAVRQSSHAKKSSWSEFAVRCEVERFPKRAVAEDAERRAIDTESPLFNAQHNGKADARQRLVAYIVERGRSDLLAPAVSRG